MSLFGGSCFKERKGGKLWMLQIFQLLNFDSWNDCYWYMDVGIIEELATCPDSVGCLLTLQSLEIEIWQAFKMSLSMCLLSRGKFILYTFWKNAIITMLLFYYTFFSGYSGTCCLEAFHQVSKGWKHHHVASTEACSPAQFGRRLAWSFFGLSSLLVFLTGMSQMSKRSNTQHCMRRDALDWSLPCTLDKYLTLDRSLLGWFCCPASNSGSRHLYTFVRK